jgi:hypothetical protein
MGTLAAMSARAIVTSQPDVACYVCERRLLRGEQPEIFLIENERRTVCELCAPRAADHGWPRGGEGLAHVEPPVRSRRSGGLFTRLRQAAFPASVRTVAEGADPADARALARREQIDLSGAADGVAPSGEETAGSGGEAPPAGPVELALQAFNHAEHPRRIASLARSLGAPDVSVRLDEDLGVVLIVVAWELCWYRYRIDLDDPQLEVKRLAEGTTPDQLARADRLRNALADEHGALSLLAERV